MGRVMDDRSTPTTGGSSALIPPFFEWLLPLLAPWIQKSLKAFIPKVVRYLRQLPAAWWDRPNPLCSLEDRTYGMAEAWARKAARGGDRMLRDPWGSVPREAVFQVRFEDGPVWLPFAWPDGSRARVNMNGRDFRIRLEKPDPEAALKWIALSKNDRQLHKIEDWVPRRGWIRWVDQVREHYPGRSECVVLLEDNTVLLVAQDRLPLPVSRAS